MRLYTIEEARGILPTVVPLLEELRRTFTSLRAMQAAMASDSRGATGDGALLANAWETGDGRDEVERLNRELRAAATRLDRLGIELKDPDRGLIDFYSDRSGETVFLCYLLGEPDLAWWHRIADGFAGRRPL